MTTFPSEPAPSLFIISNSCMWPSWTTDQKEENMDTITHDQIVGIDVSRDWLDIHCMPDRKRLRLPNKVMGHEHVADANRFRKTADVGAFLGLTPRRHQSGEVD